MWFNISWHFSLLLLSIQSSKIWRSRLNFSTPHDTVQHKYRNIYNTRDSQTSPASILLHSKATKELVKAVYRSSPNTSLAAFRQQLTPNSIHSCLRVSYASSAPSAKNKTIFFSQNIPEGGVPRTRCACGRHYKEGGSGLDEARVPRSRFGAGTVKHQERQRATSYSRVVAPLALYRSSFHHNAVTQCLLCTRYLYTSSFHLRPQPCTVDTFTSTVAK